jgi:putative transcriptional regulator
MKKSNLFQDLKNGLEEAIAWEQGKIDLRTTTLTLPEKPPKMTKKQIKDLRENTLKVSQPVFALILGVSPAAVKAWEQGLKQPSGTARRLMQLFGKDPNSFHKLAS